MSKHSLDFTMCASHYRKTSTIWAREKLRIVTERWEAELYGDICCAKPSQAAVWTQKSQLRLDFTVTPRPVWLERNFKRLLKDEKMNFMKLWIIDSWWWIIRRSNDIPVTGKNWWHMMSRERQVWRSDKAPKTPVDL